MVESVAFNGYVKPSRTRFFSTALWADEVQLNRVQQLGSTSRLNQADIEELGNLNILEFVDEVPTVDITVDTNEYGSTLTLGAFTNMGYGCNVVAIPSGTGINSAPGTAAFQIYPGSYYVNGIRVFFNGVTSVSVPSGNTYYTVSLSPNPNANPQWVLTQGSAGATSAPPAPSGNIPIASFSVGANGVVLQANIQDLRPWNQITLLDFEYAKADLYVPIKRPRDSNIERTMYMANCYVDRLDFSYQTKGIATENYTLETDNKKWLLQQASNIYRDQFYVTASGTTTFTLTYPPTELQNGQYTLLARYGTNGVGYVLTEGVDFVVSGQTVTLQGFSANAGDILNFRYATASGGTFFNPVPTVITSHPTPAGGLEEGQLELFLSDDSTNEVLRVQSVRISAQLRRDVLSQLGQYRPYDRPLDLPVQVTVSVQVLDSDLDLWARLAGISYSPTAGMGAVNVISLEDFKKTLGLTMKIYRETDIIRSHLPAGHPAQYPLKTITINELIPTDEQWNVRVGSDATQTLSFKAYNMTVTSVLG